MTMRQDKSQRDDPITPRYAMSGFHNKTDDNDRPQPKMPANAQAITGMTCS